MKCTWSLKKSIDYLIQTRSKFCIDFIFHFQMANVWPRRQRSTTTVFAIYWCWLVSVVWHRPCHAVTSSIQTTSLVLEEVLEHGPLFDELEDEAWWSGVDVVDTALRSWPELATVASPAVDPATGQLTLVAAANPSTDEEDFCRLWNSVVDSSSSSLQTEACLVMNRAMAVDLSVSGSSQMMLLPRLPPPPPVPPTLTELVKQLNQLSQLQQEHQAASNNDNSECLLCQWATLNGTIDLLPNSGRPISLKNHF